MGTKEGLKSTETVLSGKSAVGVYFSAHWCPPCRGFTPELAKMYSEAFSGKGMEIVFVSSDRDESSFNDYYGEMPWVALPFDKRDAKATLSKKYKVQGIPSFVILGPDGKTITADGALQSRRILRAKGTHGCHQLPPKRPRWCLTFLGPRQFLRLLAKPLGFISLLIGAHL